MKIEINNLTREEMKEINTVEKVLEEACKKEKLKEVLFNVIIVDDDYIHTLNRTYRKMDRITDVITFALEDEKSMKSPIRVLGDIYICLDQAKRQSKEYGHTLERELCFLAVHGFYHLLGYDHETKEEEKIMFAKQEEILNQCGIKR